MCAEGGPHLGEVFLFCSQNTKAVCDVVWRVVTACHLFSKALHGADHAGVPHSRQEWLEEDSEEQLGWANSPGH